MIRFGHKQASSYNTAREGRWRITVSKGYLLGIPNGNNIDYGQDNMCFTELQHSGDPGFWPLHLRKFCQSVV